MGFLGSTKAPENSFTALCNTILTQIYENSGKQNPKNSDFDGHIEKFVELGHAKSKNSVKLRRTHTAQVSPILEIPAQANPIEFKRIISRQKSELDDLRSRLGEKKRNDEM